MLQKFLKKFKNKKILICGLGRSNITVINLLISNKIFVDIYDKKDVLGFENLKFNKYVKFRISDESVWEEDYDIVIRTPGMSFYNEKIVNMREKNCFVTSEMEIFFELCPCMIIGVTGSDGKTTTTSIISEILKKSGKIVHTGGNIGNSLLDIIDKINEQDIVVLELSSFQLMSMTKSPDIAVVTNISPNHLDVHKNMEEYVYSKKQIILHQDCFSRAVLNYDNYETRNFEQNIRGNAVFFSSKVNIINKFKDKKILGTWVWIDDDKNIIYTENNKHELILNINDIKIPGMHNVENYLASIGAIKKLVNIDNINQVAQEFSGVKHRIEFVRNINGVCYYNDSIATTPSRTINGALSVFNNKKIILICGGYDKKIPFDNLAQEIIKKVSYVILMGDSAQKIHENILKYNNNLLKINIVNNMKEAIFETQKYLENVNNIDKKDYVVVLSPACASYGLYKNFEERGQDFINLVNNIK